MSCAALAVAVPGSRLLLECGNQGLRRIAFLTEAESTIKSQGSHPVLQEAARQIQAYFAGEIRAFELPLDLEGTEFQRRVWQALRAIPYAETITYQDLAKCIGQPKASRAVGSANGRNPLPIVIPCHRVIATGGGLGGYSCGIAYKRMLLELERRHGPVLRSA